MADAKISALTAHTTPIDTDVFPIVDVTAGATKKITIVTLRTDIQADTALDNLSDVAAPTPTLDDVLRWNGTNWISGAAVSASGSPGIEFFNATPTITAAGANNDIVINSLSKTPVVTAEQTVSGTAVSNTVAFAAWLYNTALGRTTIDAGQWTFNTYCAVNSIAGGRVTTLTRQIYSATPFATGTVTITGSGTSRTATASAGTPFATAAIDASATNTTASFLQTPAGLYQITARTSDTVVTILTPTTYSNESAVAGTVWKKLFGVTTPTITATGTNYSLVEFVTSQSSFTVTAAAKLGAISFVTSNNTTTLTLTYDGTTRNSHFETPLITLHNNLAGLQGGTSNEYYHLTSAQYSALGPIPVKAIGSELDTGTDDAKFATAKAINDSHNVPSVAPGTTGNVMTSDGTDWVSSTPGPTGGNYSISLADDSFSGTTSTLTAGENLAIDDVCYRKSDGKMWKADSSAIATSSAIAIALGTINADATGSFGMVGYFRDDSAFNWTVGGLLYLSETAGGIVQTAPTAANSVTQVLGVAMTADIIYFNPSLVQVEHV